MKGAPVIAGTLSLTVLRSLGRKLKSAEFGRCHQPAWIEHEHVLPVDEARAGGPARKRCLGRAIR